MVDVLQTYRDVSCGRYQVQGYGIPFILPSNKDEEKDIAFLRIVS